MIDNNCSFSSSDNFSDKSRVEVQVIDKFGKDVDVSAYDENSFKVTVTTSVGNVFYSWIFGFGGRVYINSPEDVRAEYAKMLAAAANALEK